MSVQAAFPAIATRPEHAEAEEFAQLIRAVHGRLRHFTLPAPRLLVRPYLWIFLAVRGVIFFLRRVLMAEPLFKAYCTRFGRGVTTGIYVP